MNLNKKRLQESLKPYPDNKMKYYQVSTLINLSKNYNEEVLTSELDNLNQKIYII